MNSTNQAKAIRTPKESCFAKRITPRTSGAQASLKAADAHLIPATLITCLQGTKTMTKTRALIATLLLSLTPVLAAQAGQVDQAARIAASIAPTTAQTVPHATPGEVAPVSNAQKGRDVDSITALCMASSPAACGAGAATNQASMAYCDVEDTGFSKCLHQYASALVKHAPRARETFKVTLQAADGTLTTTTVLLPKGATSADAAAKALENTTGEKVTAVI